jgi:hypothetical protein
MQIDQGPDPQNPIFGRDLSTRAKYGASMVCCTLPAACVLDIATGTGLVAEAALGSVVRLAASLLPTFSGLVTRPF